MINNVTLVGRLTKDPELKYTPNGVAVATFTLAVNRSYKNSEGNYEADFINCVVWRKPAENVANFLKKGSLAGVTGSIQTRNFDNQEGKRQYVTEVLAERVQFLESKGTGQGGQTGGQTGGNTGTGSGDSSSKPEYTKVDEDPFANNGKPIDISDDDLPF
ncbi:single-stranded DNA-binding protein [Bacillus sp. M6-12]|uniref:single-stranded DNA-binding protein n=1 Tax=Bacillus sp. M6-12 TaxID=2054166 RepID=UPI000C7566B3|nr:single-stranded DNA-binding protein [Bacillus sp. M6-12]PLS18953.1 single-stranded DNA-binding protein [Bacillus sp. M6-12]